MKLDKEDFVSIGQRLKPGETINTFHCKKGSGNDRLYVTRTKNGNTIVAYCHHCGGKGVHQLVKGMEQSLADAESILNEDKEVNIVKELPFPEDLEYNLEEWDTIAKSWILSSSVTPVEIATHAIAYSPSLRRVVIPVIDDNGETVGFQTRRIFKSDRGPKYRTYKKESINLFMNNKADVSKDKSTCVLVEDKLSAIRCSRFFDTIWILGTQVGTNLTHYLSTNYENVILFLDNDNHQVKEKQERLHRILSTVMKRKVMMCWAEKDPKKYHHMELLTKLTGCLV